jgi:hypothetical protein
VSCSAFALGDDLEQQFCTGRIDLDNADVIEQQQIQPAVAGYHTGENAFVGVLDVEF